jgi:hypothetical protein
MRHRVSKNVLPSISEADFQQSVIELARALGWIVAHFRGVRIQRANGQIYYQTPVSADGKGFPDLVLAHPKKQRTIFAELKSEDGKVSPEQQGWLDILQVNRGVEVYVWKPSEWEDIKVILMDTDALTETAIKLNEACERK